MMVAMVVGILMLRISDITTVYDSLLHNENLSDEQLPKHRSSCVDDICCIQHSELLHNTQFHTYKNLYHFMQQ